jgi:hypothetical protein
VFEALAGFGELVEQQQREDYDRQHGANGAAGMLAPMGRHLESLGDLHHEPDARDGP